MRVGGLEFLPWFLIRVFDRENCGDNWRNSDLKLCIPMFPVSVVCRGQFGCSGSFFCGVRVEYCLFFVSSLASSSIDCVVCVAFGGRNSCRLGGLVVQLWLDVDEAWFFF